MKPPSPRLLPALLSLMLFCGTETRAEEEDYDAQEETEDYDQAKKGITIGTDSQEFIRLNEDGSKNVELFWNALHYSQIQTSKIKIRERYKPKPREEFILTETIYEWKSEEGNLEITDPGKKTTDVKTKDASWGTKNVVSGKVIWKMEHKDASDIKDDLESESAKATIYTPMIELDEITFNHDNTSATNDGFDILSEFKGEIVKIPEWDKQSLSVNAQDQEQTAVGYIKNIKPKVKFKLTMKPAELSKYEFIVKFTSKTTILQGTLEGKAKPVHNKWEDYCTADTAIKDEVQSGTIDGELTLELKENVLNKTHNMGEHGAIQAFVTLSEANTAVGEPWIFGLTTAIDTLAAKGAKNDKTALTKLTNHLRGRFAYIEEEQYTTEEEIDEDSSIVIVNNYDLSGAVESGIYSCNCADANAGVYSYANYIGCKGITSKYAAWFEKHFVKDPQTGVESLKLKPVAHLYNIYQQLVYDAVPGGNDDFTGKNNEKDHLKKYFNVDIQKLTHHLEYIITE